MEGYHIRARRDKAVNILGGVAYHHVYIKKKLAVRTKRRNEVGTEADIGYKMTVHYIEVKKIRSRFFNASHAVAKLGIISRQQ